MAKRFTLEQRNKLISEVEALRKQGMSAKRACEKAKVNFSNYNYWMRASKPMEGAAFGGGSSRFVNVNLPGVKGQPMVIAIGKPKDINIALKNLATIFGASN